MTDELYGLDSHISDKEDILSLQPEQRELEQVPRGLQIPPAGAIS